MLKKLIITLVLLVAILGPVVGLKVLQIGNLIAFAQGMEKAGYPPTAVSTAIAGEQSWEDTIVAVASLSPVQGVTLSAELGGKVTEIAVESGARVKAGDLLIRIEASTEEAQLAATEASARLTEINLERTKDLLGKGTVSQAEFDRAEAEHKQSLAQVANYRSVVAKKVIRAPFDGRVGIRLVNLGQTVTAGDLIIPLQALDPIFVDFSVPQQHVSKIAEGQKIRVSVTGVEGVVEGTVTAINPQVDVSTRNIRLQGRIANPDERLRPGMFGEVTVVLPTAQKVVAIPATAVQHAPYGDSVFVVDDKDGKKVARQQFVRLGVARGDFVSVLDGLKGGERVVSAGGFKLMPGAALTIDDKMQPETSLTPKPNNS